MRRTLLDVPNIVTLYNVRKIKYVRTKLYFNGVHFKGYVFALYRTLFHYLNQFGQTNLRILSESFFQKSVILIHFFSRPNVRNYLISIYFRVNYKPINKNYHESDAFDYSRHFRAL